MVIRLRASGGGRNRSSFSRRVFGPELFARHEQERPNTQGEAERRKAHTERPLRAIAALPLGGVTARAAFGGHARLPALSRGSCRDFTLDSVRSRASWQHQRITPSATRGSQLLADLPILSD